SNYQFEQIRKNVLVSKDYCKSLSKNIELFEGVREVIVFNREGMVFSHNIKSFAVRKAVLVFLFHHLNELLARAASQLTPIWFVGRSATAKLIIGQLVGDIFVAVTADNHLDETRLNEYLAACAAAEPQ